MAAELSTIQTFKYLLLNLPENTIPTLCLHIVTHWFCPHSSTQPEACPHCSLPDSQSVLTFFECPHKMISQYHTRCFYSHGSQFLVTSSMSDELSRELWLIEFDATVIVSSDMATTEPQKEAACVLTLAEASCWAPRYWGSHCWAPARTCSAVQGRGSAFGPAGPEQRRVNCAQGGEMFWM